MNKRNIFLQTAVASALVALSFGAQAVVANPAGITFASEIFGTGSDATTLANAGAAMSPAYTMGVARTIAAGTFQYKVTLANAVFAVAPTAASLGLTGAGAATISIRTGGAIGDNTVTFDVTPTTDMTTASVLTFTTPSLKSASALATVGTKIQATIALSDLFGAFDTAGLHTADLAVSAASLTGVTAATTATGTAPLSGTIDAISQASKFFLNGTTAGSKTVSLGSVTFANVTAKQADGTTDRVKLVGDSIAVTVTGDFSAALAVSAAPKGVYLSTSAATCTTVAAIAATTLTATTATFTAVPGNTANVGICMTVDGVSVIVATAPTAVASYTPAITTEKALAVASAALLPLALNVTQKDVRSYIPAATVGYTGFVRFINTGSVAAPVKGMFVAANGSVGAEGTIIASLPAGGSTTLTAAAIETAMGVTAPIATERPRLRVTAATGSFDLQSFFLTNANGNFSEVSGAQ